jgi:hypothetical protein
VSGSHDSIEQALCQKRALDAYFTSKIQDAAGGSVITRHPITGASRLSKSPAMARSLCKMEEPPMTTEPNTPAIAPEAVKVDLLPCPFCNSTAIVIGESAVRCAFCYTSGPRKPLSRAEATAAWNTRPNLTPAAPDGLLERADLALAMDAPTASDREWSDLLAVSMDMRDLITAQAARIEALEKIAKQPLNNPPGDALTRRDMIILARAALKGEPTPTDWWKPDPEDPFWMLEAEDGEWLKNKYSMLGTRDATKAIRFPTERAANNVQAAKTPGYKWWSAKATEHLWINMGEPT